LRPEVSSFEQLLEPIDGTAHGPLAVTGFGGDLFEGVVLQPQLQDAALERITCSSSSVGAMASAGEGSRECNWSAN
jgi:hypothetical protein